MANIASETEEMLDAFRSTLVFRGEVTAVAGQLSTVSRAGQSWPNLPHLASYTPQVGDEVICLHVGGGWIVIGEVSR